MGKADILLIGKLIDAALAITGVLTNAGINYREVMDEQDLADAEGRSVDTDKFLAQAQDAIDQL